MENNMENNNEMDMEIEMITEKENSNAVYEFKNKSNPFVKGPISTGSTSKGLAKFHKFLTVVFSICEAFGYHLEGHIVVKDVRTGKIWK